MGGGRPKSMYISYVFACSLPVNSYVFLLFPAIKVETRSELLVDVLCSQGCWPRNLVAFTEVDRSHNHLITCKAYGFESEEKNNNHLNVWRAVL